MIKATNIYALTAKIPAWRYDPNISRKNDCRVFRLDYSDRTALASRHNCPHEGPGWKVQIIGQLPYYYSDRLTLDEITEGVKADIDFLAQPVVVIVAPPSPPWPAKLAAAVVHIGSGVWRSECEHCQERFEGDWTDASNFSNDHNKWQNCQR